MSPGQSAALRCAPAAPAAALKAAARAPARRAASHRRSEPQGRNAPRAGWATRPLVRGNYVARKLLHVVLLSPRRGGHRLARHRHLGKVRGGVARGLPGARAPAARRPPRRRCSCSKGRTEAPAAARRNVRCAEAGGRRASAPAPAPASPGRPAVGCAAAAAERRRSWRQRPRRRVGLQLVCAAAWRRRRAGGCEPRKVARRCEPRHVDAYVAYQSCRARCWRCQWKHGSTSLPPLSEAHTRHGGAQPALLTACCPMTRAARGAVVGVVGV